MPFNQPLNIAFEANSDLSFQVMLHKYFMEAYLLIDGVLQEDASLLPVADFPAQIPTSHTYRYESLCLTIGLFKKLKGLWPNIKTEDHLQATLRRIAFHEAIDYPRAFREGWKQRNVKTKLVSSDLICYFFAARGT